MYSGLVPSERRKSNDEETLIRSLAKYSGFPVKDVKAARAILGLRSSDPHIRIAEYVSLPVTSVWTSKGLAEFTAS